MWIPTFDFAVDCCRVFLVSSVLFVGYFLQLAKESGYDVNQIAGTGPRGRVLAADVLEFDGAAAPVADSAGAAPAVAAAAAAPVFGADYTDMPVNEATLARAMAMVDAKQNIPHYYLTIDMNVDNLLGVRSNLNDTLTEDDALSTNDFFIKATALTMKKNPDMNATWMDAFVRHYHSVNMGLTIGDGLIVPVVSNTESKGLYAISTEVKSLIEKAESNTLSSADVQVNGNGTPW